MFVQILALIIIIILCLIWWRVLNMNIVYFDGGEIFQIPGPLLTVGKKNSIEISVRFPTKTVHDGIILFTRKRNNFYIAYIQDRKLIVNNSNNHEQLVILHSDLKPHRWYNFEMLIPDDFKLSRIYFGDGPKQQIPLNSLAIDGKTKQFPTNGLIGCTNYCYLDDINLSELFQEKGLTKKC